jgi:hypothetical protein
MWISLSGIGTLVTWIAVAMVLTGLGLWLVGHSVGSTGLRIVGAIVAAPIVLCVVLQFGSVISDGLHETRLTQRVLRRDEVLNGIPLPKGTTLHVRRDYLPWSSDWLANARLDSPRVIKGVSIVGDVTFGYEETNEPDPSDARLKQATLAVDQDIDGIPCKGGVVASFDDQQKRLASCILSRPLMVDGAECAAGTEISLKVVVCRMTGPGI